MCSWIAEKLLIQEHQKYRAEVFKIFGIALMTPMCRVVLTFLDFGTQMFNIQYLTNVLFSLVLFVFGVIMIQVGFECVQD